MPMPSTDTKQRLNDLIIKYCFKVKSKWFICVATHGRGEFQYHLNPNFRKNLIGPTVNAKKKSYHETPIKLLSTPWLAISPDLYVGGTTTPHSTEQTLQHSCPFYSLYLRNRWLPPSLSSPYFPNILRLYKLDNTLSCSITDLSDQPLYGNTASPLLLLLLILICFFFFVSPCSLPHHQGLWD